MPGGEIRDADPGGNPGPEPRQPGSQEHGRVASSGGADEIDAVAVNRGLLHRPFNGALDVLHHQLGTAGLRPPVRSAEVRVDEHPALLDTPLRVGNVVAVFIVAAPGVEANEQRAGFLCIGGVEESRLFSLVSLTPIANLAHAGRPVLDGLRAGKGHHRQEEAGGLFHKNCPGGRLHRSVNGGFRIITGQ